MTPSVAMRRVSRPKLPTVSDRALKPRSRMTSSPSRNAGTSTTARATYGIQRSTWPSRPPSVVPISMKMPNMIP